MTTTNNSTSAATGTAAEELTAKERLILRGIKDAFAAINSPSLSLTQIEGWISSGISYGELVEGLISLRKKGYIQLEVIARTPRYYLMSKGKEVEA